MDIRCEKCQVEYALDEKLLSPAGTPVRCTNCDHVFNAYPSSGAKANPTVAWTALDGAGKMLEFNNLPALQEWIKSGAAHPKDRVSKFGGPWRTVESVPELADFIRSSQKARVSITPKGAGYMGKSGNTSRQKTIAGVGQTKPGAGSTANSEQVPMSIKQVASNRTTNQPGPISKSKQSEIERQPTLAVSVAPAADSRPHLTQDLMTGDTILSSPNQPQDSRPKDSLTNGNTIKATAAATPPSRDSLTSGDTLKAAALTPSEINRGFDTTQLHNSQPEAPAFENRSHTDPAMNAAAQTSPEPAWTDNNRKITTSVAIDEEFIAQPVYTGRTRKIIVGVVLLVLIGLGVLAFLDRSAIISRFGEVQDSKKLERKNALLLEAEEKVLLDTPDEFDRAEKKYLQILAIDKDDASALAHLARLDGIWAQYLLDQIIDRQTDTQKTDMQPTNTAQLLEQFDKLVRQANSYADQALRLQDLPLAHLAKSDAARLGGDLELARQHLAMGRADELTRESAYLGALIEMNGQGDLAEIIGMLKSADGQPPLLRVLYRLARTQAAAGKLDDAKETIGRIMGLNSHHLATMGLKKRIAAGQTIALVLQGTSPPADSDSVALPGNGTANQGAPKADKGASVNTAVATGTAAEPADSKNKGGDPDTLLQKAITAQENGRTNEAVSLYNQVLAKQPGNLDALTGLAYTYLDKGATGQAIAKFKLAYNASSSYGPAIIGMANTYKSMGYKGEALKWYQIYLDKNPNGRYAGLAKRNIADLGGGDNKELGLPQEKSNSAEATPAISSENSLPSTKPTNTADAPPPAAPSAGQPVARDTAGL